MYVLRVFYPGSPTPDETVSVTDAAHVLTRIPELLEKHPGCEKVVVMAEGLRLFAVD